MAKENLLFALMISLLAGLCSLVGGFILFIPKEFGIKHRRVILGVGLAVASGVMLYVSFAEIYLKALDSAALGLERGVTCKLSYDSAEDETIESNNHKVIGFTYPAHTWVSCFVNLLVFAGMLLCRILDVVAHCISPAQSGIEPQNVVRPRFNCDERRAEDVENAQQDPNSETPGLSSPRVEPDAQQEHQTATKEEDPDQPDGLMQLGILSVLAIGIHNAPEGLATFTATLNDPSLGIRLAVGIGLHNIPEGICVAIPIYYATGSRIKALLWTLLCGIAEPIGGILGYLALSQVMGDLTYAVIFAVVTGMMLYIAIVEYIPAALALGMSKDLVTFYLLLGMSVMWLSILIINVN